MTTENTETETKGFIQKQNNKTNQKRIEDDEKEIAEMLKAQTQELEEGEEKTEGNPEDTSEASKENENLSVEEERFKKRYGDLRRHSQKEIEALKSQIEELKKTNTGTPEDQEDLEEWVKKNPKVAKIVEAIAEQKASEKFSTADKKFKEIEDLNYEATLERETQKIRKAHPDFDTLKESDEFHDWVDEQALWVRKAAYENIDDAASVISVIDLYKVHNGLTARDVKNTAKEAATAVKGGKKTSPVAKAEERAFSESDVKAMSTKEFEENFDKIVEQQRKGTFVYNLS